MIKNRAQVVVLTVLTLVAANASTKEANVATPASPPRLALSSPPAALPFTGKHYGDLPLTFESNQGQAGGGVAFLARGPGYGLFLAPAEVVLSLAEGAMHAPSQPNRSTPPASKAATIVRMVLLDADSQPQLHGETPLSSRSHYLIGNNPEKWHTNVRQFAKVRYHNIYPGIDQVYYGNQHQLEYDFVVAPGANPQQIKLLFNGVDTLRLDAQGNLILHTASGDLVQHKPVIYQTIAGKHITRAGHYVLAENQVGFQVASYDKSQPLVIDPVLSYSTFVGGGGADSAYAIAVSGNGNAYITGTTQSINFPTSSGAYDRTCGSDNACSPNVFGVSADAFVAKLNAAGTALVYSTYLGGNGNDAGRAIVVDGGGNATITGETFSQNFPTSTGAYDRSCGTDGICNGGLRGVFVTKLYSVGSNVLYSTFIGGSDFDQGLGIALDSRNNAYITGSTFSANFPVRSAARPIFGGAADAFVTKLNVAGTALVYSTYLGGVDTDIGRGIAVNSAGNAYIAGQTFSANFPTKNPIRAAKAGPADAFVVKLAGLGNSLVYSTYLGGNDVEQAFAIALDINGNAYVTGSTSSTNFPVTLGAFDSKCGSDAKCNSQFNAPFNDGFVTKLNAAGNAWVYSTYLGGSADDGPHSIAVDKFGNAYITGETTSADFPTKTALRPNSAGSIDAFVTKLNNAGNALVYSTYLGGKGEDRATGIALDRANNVYVAGETVSSNFPTTRWALDRSCGVNGTCTSTDQFGTHSFADAFVAKIAGT